MKKYLNWRNIVIVCCIIVLIFVSTELLKEYISGLRAVSVQKDVLELKQLGEQYAESVKAGESTSVLPDMQDEDISADTQGDDMGDPENDEAVFQDAFIPLYEVNEDIVGWLQAGDMIDFPVVQRDNEYYLRHNFYGKTDSNGNVFMDVDSSLLPRDDVIIIHGHNMKSGAIFGKLKKFMDFKYVSKYPVLSFRTIYDRQDVYYTPIAVFNASMNEGNPDYFDILQVNFKSDEEFETYLETITALSEWDARTDVNTDDKLLMLATCSYYQDNGRLMVVCRALREGERPETITALYGE